MPKGTTYPIGLRAQARALRAEGLAYRAIGERLGVPLKTAASWVLDPERSADRERKRRYAGSCRECGKPTDGSRGPGCAPKVCQDCREWPDDAVILAMQEWADSHGGVPPTCTEWRAASAHHPAASTITGQGNWNDLLLRAGFELRCDRRPGTQAEVERLLREGFTAKEGADCFGWTERNVYFRLRHRGKTVHDFQVAA
jgi:hypothetical protein